MDYYAQDGCPRSPSLAQARAALKEKTTKPVAQRAYTGIDPATIALWGAQPKIETDAAAQYDNPGLATHVRQRHQPHQPQDPEK